MLTGLTQINIELQSKCDKRHLCSFCGHQNPKIFPDLWFGEIPVELLWSIREQLPRGITVQFHRDGEPTAYSRLDKALYLFRNYITSIVTHGLNLVAKADQIIGNCTSLTVSAFHGDPDSAEQDNSLISFLLTKRDRKPMVNIKVVGKPLEDDRLVRFSELQVPIIHRALHVPGGNWKYFNAAPPIPETGICWDFLSHPSIDVKGNLYICNRLDTSNKGLLGNLNEDTLEELWNGDKRRVWLEHHINGARDKVPACVNCTYYGIPAAANYG